MLPTVTRPGICYYCRKRDGTIHTNRGMWSCPRCLVARDVQDALLIVVMIVCMATIVGMAMKRNGICQRCPDVPMPVLHFLRAWTH
ncbi:MAG TPA: hypothetical protein VFE36_01280 [Candidatus Baltobacteraceae bacterium]|nr:hypothetical protein [Candidatus Baltobacteraceae bacterium]